MNSFARGACRALLFPLGLASAFGFAVVGACLVTPYGVTSLETFTSHDSFRLWRVLIGVLLVSTMASAGACAPSVFTLLKPESWRVRGMLTLAAVLTAAVAGAVLFVGSRLVGIDEGVSKEFMRAIQCGMITVYVIALVFLVPAILIIVTVAVRASAIDVNAPAIAQIRELQAPLQTALMWLAIPISLTVIVTGQLRNALIAAGNTTEDDYPIAYVLVYGAVFAVVLAAIYVPAYGLLHERSQRVVDKVCPFTPTSEWEEKYNRTTDYLGLSTGTIEHLKTTFATASPFVASLVAFFIPTGD